VKERILVAGIGNIFLGDDGFGVEVARRLLGKLPEAARVVDFGTRGYDLAYALMDGYELAILVDATPRGGTPGTLYTLEPELERSGQISEDSGDAHGFDPVRVLAYVHAIDGKLNRVLVLGCEPASLGEEEGGRMGLSAPVEAAADEAARMIEALVMKTLAELPAQVHTTKPENAAIRGI
jgi:hydrogenase maturation protease